MHLIKNRIWQQVDTRGIVWDGTPIKQLSSRNLQRALVYCISAIDVLKKDNDKAMEEIKELEGMEDFSKELLGYKPQPVDMPTIQEGKKEFEEGLG